MKIPIPNAFTIHQLGTPGGAIPFPFSASIHKYENGIIQFELHPLQIIDIADLFTDTFRLVLFDVAFTSFDKQLSEQAPLCEAIEFYQVGCQPIDHDAVMISGIDLPNLLSGLDHYQFHAFPPGRNATLGTIEVSLSKLRRTLRVAPLLSRLPDSPFFLSSHDDCNLTLECQNPELVYRVLERAWQIYAGTILYHEIGYTGEIAGIPINILDALSLADTGWTIFRDQTRLSGNSLSIGVSAKPFHFLVDQAYPVDFYIEYQYDARVWEKTE